MLPIPNDKIRPVVTVPLEQIDKHLEQHTDDSINDYLFIEDRNRLIGYISVREMKSKNRHRMTADEIKKQTHPLETACFLGQEFSIPDLYRVIGEAVTLVKDRDGCLIGYIKREDLLVALFQDESQNTDLLKTILTSIPMGIFIADRQRRMVNFNEAGLRMTKRRASEVAHEPAENIFGRKEIDRVFTTGETILNQIVVGGQVGLLADYSPIFGPGRTINGVVIVVQDLPMVEKMAMELEYVKNLNADLNAVLSSMYDEILVLDEEGGLIRCSETLSADYWHINFKKLIGKNLLHLEAKGMFHLPVIRYVIENRKKYSVVQETSDGKKVLALGTPVFGDNGEIQRIIIALRDITETAELKTRLNEYKKELDGFRKKDLFMQQMVFRSVKMEELMIRVKKVAEFSSTVLIDGESGVGKEVVAQAIHQMGTRSSRPFLKLNCGAIPGNLLESELFGYVKGAFTGASTAGKKGYFEQADGGVLFMDEIGELPLQLQVKLLRVLQEGEVIPLGSTRPIPVNVQIVAATNRNLKEMVKAGAFREDLYYRLNVIPIHVPPLRERPEDIAVLAVHFLKQLNQKYKKHYVFMPDALNLLELYHWPGNIRELQNVVERLIVVSDSETIHADLVGNLIRFDQRVPDSHSFTNRIIPMKQAKEKLERELVVMAMKKFKTTTRAAEALGISQSSVSRKYNKILGEGH
ncbi:sigma 54-interacting transcriptional regulator [Sporolactobacillus sp. CQH2019]|uniref:sigma 54-interacting transcriptional regulator n=1 Tax=Sporolactobacillus sp. CQH2019 TaxID=3023512 RepID=UPI002368EB2A|nr:sigma 54-interacting transcriptional regulator [Sporolactobacillus sp. CQH2019]MDD9149022.1 sigma 54-interacting transcriptional regulator [Sporolactobacillus sp. CQH2019]